MLKRNIIYLLIPFIISCSRDAEYVNSAQIRFINASINSPKLDVFVDGTLLATQVSFPTISNTFFVPLGGTPTFRVAAYDGPQSGLFYGTISNSNLQNNTNYSLIAADSTGKLKVSFVTDTLRTPETGKANIRFFQLAADYTSALNFYIDTFKVAANRTFNDQATNSYLHAFTSFKEGVYTVYAKTAAGVTVASLGSVTLSSAKNYTIILKGSLSGAATTPQQLGFTVFNYN